MSKQAHIVDFEQARKSSSSRSRSSAENRSGASSANHRRTSRKGDSPARASSTSSRSSASKPQSSSRRSSSAKAAQKPRAASNGRPSSQRQSNAVKPARTARATRHALSDAELTRAARASAEAHARSRTDEGEEERAARDGLSARLRKAQRDGRKKRADRAFDKTIGASSSASQESGSRAALYKGEMGSTHRRAARMQQEQAQSAGLRSAIAMPRTALTGRSTRFYVAIVVTACLVLGAVFLYPTARNYYSAVRDQARAQAEYDAVVARNSALQSEIDELSTPEGVEDRVREEYGWVKSGENSVMVSGLDSSAESQSASTASGSTENVKAPDTWYSGVLDTVFGYQN